MGHNKKIASPKRKVIDDNSKDAMKHNYKRAVTRGMSVMKSSYLSGTAALIFLHSPVFAQAGSSPPAQIAPGSASKEDGLQEIVVTAQRRVERLQDVPIAATSIAGNQLEQKAVQRVSDLQFASPSLSVTNSGETEAVNIRGIGLSSNLPGVTNGVATYLDGLFQPQIVSTVPFYDIANVEVLRGPQGTLVGNNSTGGAIFINTANPNPHALGGYAQLTAGNYARREAEGALNLPLGETLAARVAGIYHKENSFYRDIGPYHNSPGRINEKGVRMSLLWHPGRFQALAKVQLHQASSGGWAYKPAPGTAFSFFAVPGERTVNYDVPTSQSEKAVQAELELRYELPGGITFRSLTGYQRKRNRYSNDIDATQAPISVAVDYYARDKQASEEINILSPTSGRFDWILGGYYQKNDILVDYLQTSPLPDVAYLPRQKRIIYGLFAQVNYKLTNTLEAQLGARYSHVRTSGTGDVVVGTNTPDFPVPGGVPVASLVGAHSDARVTGKAALNWKVTPDHLLYAFVARGYKPGGFNSATSEFRPETVLDYEFGWKGSFADRHLRAQIGAFYNRYKDMQFDILDPATGVAAVQNVGTSTIKGVEAQVQARFGGFAFDGGLGYVKSRIAGLTFVNTRLLPPGTLGPQCPVGVPSSPLCFDYTPFFLTTTGGPNLYSPKWTYNLGAEYRLRLGRASLTPRLNYGYVGSRFDYLAYGVGDRLPARGLLSGLLTLAVDKWRVEAFATNLTNKSYVSGRSGDNLFLGAPREYGMRVGVTF